MEAPHIPLLAAADGVVLTVRLNPRARRDAIEGVSAEAAAHGTAQVLRATVTAPPEDGKANAALLALLAKTCRLPKSAFSIVGGATHRVKRVHVRGEPAALAALLAEKLGVRRR
ncbi:MAG TPA: DUF167 family protein [Alphaproteobacteria bacterium]|nr:DUF167 family protein [Alphaproteobacteria bacterium]